MRILFLSAEVEPFAKVGGLADVAGSLPAALRELGHDVRVVMPAYGMVVNDPRWGAQKILSQFPVSVNPHTTILSDLYEIFYEDVTVWLVDGNGFFDSVMRSEEVYSPGRDAYLFFSQAALEACQRMTWIPEVVHANDWHTAFTPVFLREKYEWSDTASVYTIHNLAYQGEFGADTVEAAGLPWKTFNWQQLETWGGVNFLKSGCVYADQVNTVSPTYAREIQTDAFGCRLQGLMTFLEGQGRLSGILNGIDTKHHDPASDARLPSHFDSTNLDGKRQCRAALVSELGLSPAEGQPVLSLVSRLSEQKGFDLVLAKIHEILGTGACLVMLAIGDRWMGTKFREVEEQYRSQFRFVEAYDAELAQRVYAGTDIFLMPSSFEPCGLGQMFAMRYGTVPVVRKTGGLADSVVDGLNGFVFTERTPDHFFEAVRRAMTAFQNPEAWTRLMCAGMDADWSWAKSARAYESLYQAALSTRREVNVGLVASRW